MMPKKISLLLIGVSHHLLLKKTDKLEQLSEANSSSEQSKKLLAKRNLKRLVTYQITEKLNIFHAQK